MQLRLSFYADILSVVVIFHRCVGADPYLLHSWDRMELVFNGAVEIPELSLRISCRLRIEMDNVPIFRFELQICVLKFVEALRKKTGAHQQHERKRGLHNNQSSLQQRGTAGGACAATQGVGGLSKRRYPRGS